MLWADTSTNLLKLRNGANSAWITVGDLTAANLGLAALASPTFTGTVTIPTATISTGVGIPLGSAASPAIYFTGDTNTGIYSPGADQVAISTGGTGAVYFRNGKLGVGESNPSGLIEWRNTSTGRLEADSTSVSLNAASNVSLIFKTNDVQRAVLDTSGRLGIGTQTPGTKLTIVETANADAIAIRSADSNYSELGIGINANINAAYIQSKSSGSGTSRPLAFYGALGEWGRFDTSGRFLVGTSSSILSYANLQVTGGSDNAGHVCLANGGTAPVNGANIGSIRFTNSAGGIGAQFNCEADGAWTAGSNYRSRLTFSTTADGASSPTERMRIRNNGIIRHYVYDEWMRSDTTTSCGYIGRGDQVISGGSTDNFGISTAGGDLLFGAGGTTEAMRITSSQEVLIGGTVDIGPYALQVKSTGVWGAGAYVNGSDRSIKEDIEPLTSSIEIVKQLNPVSFRYKEDFSKDTTLQPGFVAQDLQQAFAGQPYLDGIVQAGPEFLSVAYQSLIPILTKALQEAVTKIETLEAKVAVLEAS
jgi:hypothetical protein